MDFSTLMQQASANQQYTEKRVSIIIMKDFCYCLDTVFGLVCHFVFPKFIQYNTLIHFNLYTYQHKIYYNFML